MFVLMTGLWTTQNLHRAGTRYGPEWTGKDKAESSGVVFERCTGNMCIRPSGEKKLDVSFGSG